MFLLLFSTMDNPWQVESIEAFYFLKCPECVFNTREEKVFKEHALGNHPMSFVLFGETDHNQPEILDFYLSPFTSHRMQTFNTLFVFCNLPD